MVALQPLARLHAGERREGEQQLRKERLLGRHVITKPELPRNLRIDYTHGLGDNDSVHLDSDTPSYRNAVPS